MVKSVGKPYQFQYDTRTLVKPKCRNSTNGDGSDAYPRQRAHTIALPIKTNTTGRNHFSRNFCMGCPTTSAALPLEMNGDRSERALATTIVPGPPRGNIKNLFFLQIL
jgi:hypothetical protein